MTIAKKILLEELEEQAHPERVEDVIFWALEYYHKNRKKGAWGETIAFALTENIKYAEGSAEPHRKADDQNDKVEGNWLKVQIRIKNKICSHRGNYPER